MCCRIIVIILAVLVAMATSTAPIYPFSPPAPRAPRVSRHGPIAPTPTRPVEPSTTTHRLRLRLQRVNRYEPLEPVPLQPVEPIRIHRLSEPPRLPLQRAHEYRPVEVTIPRLLEPTTVQLWEPLRLRARYSSDYETRRGRRNALNHPRTITTTCTVVTPADSGPGSLRQCLLDAAEGATINFDPQVFPPAAPVTISLQSELPWITVDGVTVDGSEAGVVLDGSRLSEGFGLAIVGAAGVTIRGLQILNFPDVGVIIGAGASDNVIGGDTPDTRNVISGNGRVGVWLQDANTTGNQVLGNYIGTDATGTRALGNGEDGDGVFIGFGASNNVIGGDTPGARNVISGNSEAGVWLQDTGTASNQVLGNYIGTDATGTRALGNSKYGVFIGFGAGDNVIGGDTPGARNLISGNGDTGVWLQNAGTTGNQVVGNYIGTDVMGRSALGNSRAGVFIGFGASDNVIGGTTPEACNVISGNGEAGVRLQDTGTAGNQVLGNYIGTDETGTTSLANVRYGVFIGFGASNNVIGGNTPGARNLISGNGQAGVWLQDANTTGNQVLGNYIGTDAEGTGALA